MFKKILLVSFLVSLLSAQKITIFAASDLKFALDDIKVEFLKQHPTDEVEMIYGSSGKGMHQIENSAPYHIFFSANMEFIEKLYKNGDITTKPKQYAIGRVVIWSKHKDFKPQIGFENLKAPWVNKIAIANPAHAPYGQKAKQALEKIGIYEDVKSKLVMGENISQATGFVANESAEIGIIALSLALAPTIANSEHNKYYVIDNKLHEALEQGYGITKFGSKSPLANSFYEYMESEKANTIMAKYGFR